MPGLTTSLLTAMHALLAQQGALNATTNNIANVNTPGYSRQRPIFEESVSIQGGNHTAGNGVVLEGFESVRDQLLELRIQQQTWQQHGAQARSMELAQIQPLFTTTGQDIGSEMTAFFAKLSELSSNPANPSLRQGVLSAAQNLVNAFHNTAYGLTVEQTDLNGQVAQDVEKINQLTSKIAMLNGQLAVLKASGQTAGMVQDQITEATRQLSEITEIHITQSDSGIVLTTAEGTALVVGQHSYQLRSTMLADGKQHVIGPDGRDISDGIMFGHLGGSLQMRDKIIPDIMDKLDTLAYEFANAFNTVHRNGFDSAGTAGQNFFGVPATSSGAAHGISVLISDAALVAASLDATAPGGGGNLTNLLDLEDTTLPSGQTPTGTYSSLVFHVGTLAANATADAEALDQAVQQLSDQRSSVSGVSIDEETTNMIRYQQAYQASAKVISVVNDLISTVINMVR